GYASGAGEAPRHLHLQRQQVPVQVWRSLRLPLAYPQAPIGFDHGKALAGNKAAGLAPCFRNILYTWQHNHHSPKNRRASAMPIKWPIKYSKTTSRHNEWSTLKKKHAAAIKASKVDFDAGLGGAVDKFENLIKKVAAAGYGNTATNADLEKVTQAGL